jgi:hypothetical protein
MPGNPLTDPNWAPELADTIERVVGTVREKATTKAVTAVRALVFGLTIAAAAIVAIVLLVILGTKVLQLLLNMTDAIEEDAAVGVSYLLMGTVLCIGGWVCMRKRTTKDAT